MKNNNLLKIHTIIGLVIGVFILVLSLSGALLVFREDIDALQKPVLLPLKTNNKLLTVDSCYSIVQHNYPNAVISSVSLAENIQQLISFSIYDSSYQNGTKAMQLFLHPQTGVILKNRGGSEDFRHNFMSWLSAFHNSFHASKIGEWLLGFFAILFLLSIITGMALYRKNIAKVLLFNKSIFKKNNFHQILGTWALLFNLMIGITGFWMQRYVFKKEFYKSNNWVNTIKPSPNLFFNFDSAYNSLQKQYPYFTGYVIYFAQNKNAKTAIYGSNKNNAYIHSKKFADLIALDSTGAIAKTRFINDISAADRYDIINSQLHMGKYGGLGIKILYFVLGLTSAFLSITGFTLWLKRRKK